jgi:5-carboxymethyl-2-hydroxymuconate isomerase
MPHITIEYSAGTGERIDVGTLVKAVHRTARDSGHFAPNVVRTLAREADYSCVADEIEQNGFIQIIMRMAPGRTREDRKEIAQLVFAAAAATMAAELDKGRLALRVDMTESDPELSVSRSTLPP